MLLNELYSFVFFSLLSNLPATNKSVSNSNFIRPTSDDCIFLPFREPLFIFRENRNTDTKALVFVGIFCNYNLG